MAHRNIAGGPNQLIRSTEALRRQHLRRTHIDDQYTAGGGGGLPGEARSPSGAPAAQEWLQVLGPAELDPTPGPHTIGELCTAKFRTVSSCQDVSTAGPRRLGLH